MAGTEVAAASPGHEHGATTSTRSTGNRHRPIQDMPGATTAGCPLQGATPGRGCSLTPAATAAASGPTCPRPDLPARQLAIRGPAASGGDHAAASEWPAVIAPATPAGRSSAPGTQVAMQGNGRVPAPNDSERQRDPAAESRCERGEAQTARPSRGAAGVLPEPQTPDIAGHTPARPAAKHEPARLPQSANRQRAAPARTASAQRPPGPAASAIRSFSPGLRSRSGACRPVRRHISTRSASPHGAACPGRSSPPPPQGTPQPATQRRRRSQLNSSGPPVGHDRSVDPMRCEAKTRHQARTTLLAAAPRLGRTAWLPWWSPVQGSGRDWSEQEAAC